jgi:hypothetical protein
MPDWNLPQTWNEAYSKFGGRPGRLGEGVHVTYLDGRSYQEQLADDGMPGLSSMRHRLQRLSGGGINPAAETLIAGCGFGWFIEVLVDIGANQVWGTDTSTVIQSLLDDEGVAVRSDVRPLVFDIDILAADAADQFQAVGAGNNRGLFRNVVTEHMLEGWPTADLGTVLDACDALLAGGQSNVYHLIISTDTVADISQMDPVYFENRLSLAEWVAIRPEHVWIDLNGNVGGGQ